MRVPKVFASSFLLVLTYCQGGAQSERVQDHNDDGGDVAPLHVDAELRDVSHTPDAEVTKDSSAVDAAIEDVDAQTVGDAGQDPVCEFGTEPVHTTLRDPRHYLSHTRLRELETCAALHPNLASVFVDGFLVELARAGGQIWEADSAYIVYRGDARGLSVSGSFDQWPEPGLRNFVNIAHTDLHVATLPLSRQARYQYKLTRVVNGIVVWAEHLLNPWVVWDGIDTGGVGRFNQELFGPEHVFEKSTLYRGFVVDREVYVQLPLAHLAGESLPVLYVQDGNEMLTRAGMQTVVDQNIANGRSAPVVVAYVALPTQASRMDDYTFGTRTSRGDAYVQYLAEQVVPHVESYFLSHNVASSRGLAGASLGGLIAFYGIATHNDVFELIGAQSASLFWENDAMVQRFGRDPQLNARIYLDSGSPGDNSEVTRRMAETLLRRGYDYHHVEAAEATHDWYHWAQRFDELLEFLYPL